jgi:hypothetical protein
MFSGDCNAASHGRAKWSIAYVRSSVDSVHRLKAVHLISWQYPLARIPFIAVPIEPGLTYNNCVPVGRRQKTAAFDAVFGVIPTPVQGVSPAALNFRGGTQAAQVYRHLALARASPSW